MSDVHYRTVEVDRVKIFYREAGSTSLPNLLLLHGHASGSYTFRNIMVPLSSTFHVIAPDYPGFGNSDQPDPKDFSYTFDNLARTIDKLTEQLSLTKFYIYIFDYGSPIGFRIACKHPERIAGIFTQNGNAYVEGLAPAWADIKATWNDPENQEKLDALRPIISPEGLLQVYQAGVDPPSLVGPDSAALDTYYLSRPGAVEIQLALFRDYGSNVKLYPEWQAYLREYKPKVVGLWGRNDPFFLPAGAEAFRRDVPDADIGILDDAGHFVVDTHPEEIVKAVQKLLL